LGSALVIRDRPLSAPIIGKSKIGGKPFTLALETNIPEDWSNILASNYAYDNHIKSCVPKSINHLVLYIQIDNGMVGLNHVTSWR
jgi:hypothetical protein